MAKIAPKAQPVEHSMSAPYTGFTTCSPTRHARCGPDRVARGRPLADTQQAFRDQVHQLVNGRDPYTYDVVFPPEAAMVAVRHVRSPVPIV